MFHAKNIHNRRKGLSLLASLGLVALLLLVQTSAALAATSPSLGTASSFGILSSTYTNTAAGTVINGDLGYTTGPAMDPTLNGTLYTPIILPPTYSQAGTSQGAALAALASQACTHTFPSGAVDLATDTSHGPIGVYTPGVYCTTATSAASIGTAGITLSGSGTYIFRIDGPLTTVANSAVRFSNGASACNTNVFWTPTGATTLGATSTFAGTVIDDTGITVGTTVTWTGRALAFGGTVTATGLAMTVPTCLTLTKTVIGGAKTVSDFPLFVGATPVTSGVASSFIPGTYTASETTDPGYTASVWGGNCNSAGSVTLANGDNKTCTITNTVIGAPPAATLTLIKTVINTNGGIKTVSDFPLFVGATSVASGAVTIVAPGTYTVSETPDTAYTASIWGGDCSAGGSVTLAAGDNGTCTITNTYIPPVMAALTLIKTVNGGSALSNAWTLSASGPIIISGATGTLAVTNAPVSPGSYALSESVGPIGYTASLYTCVKTAAAGGPPITTVSNTISLASGDTAICTITNTYFPTATSVPTLNEWGLIIFMMLAGLGSVYYLRKYRRV